MTTFSEKYGDVTTEAAILQNLEEINQLLKLLSSPPVKTKVKRKSYYKPKTKT